MYEKRLDWKDKVNFKIHASQSGSQIARYTNIFKGVSVAKNSLRPESAPLKTPSFKYDIGMRNLFSNIYL